MRRSQKRREASVDPSDLAHLVNEVSAGAGLDPQRLREAVEAELKQFAYSRSRPATAVISAARELGGLLTYYSRCRSGKRWLWVVSREWMYSDDDNDILDWGYSDTHEEAEAQARKHPGWFCDEGPRRAQCYLTRMARSRRQARPPAKTSGTTQVEYVYRDHDPECGEPYSTPYRVIKKTNRRVYIDTNDFPHAEPNLVILDRAELESKGSAHSRSKHARGYYYTVPMEQRQRQRYGETPECLVLLGLTQPVTEDQIKRAYRTLVKEAHPDRGGNHEACTQLMSAYELALRFAS